MCECSLLHCTKFTQTAFRSLLLCIFERLTREAGAAQILLEWRAMFCPRASAPHRVVQTGRCASIRAYAGIGPHSAMRCASRFRTHRRRIRLGRSYAAASRHVGDGLRVRRGPIAFVAVRRRQAQRSGCVAIAQSGLARARVAAAVMLRAPSARAIPCASREGLRHRVA